MADISKIKVGSTTYNIKDATGRAAVKWKPRTVLFESSTAWARGVSKTLSTAPNYLFFGAATQNGSGTYDSDVAYIGTWTYPNSRTTDQTVVLATCFDTGTHSYFMKATFSVSGEGKTWKFVAASGHDLLPSGNTGYSNTIRKFWGIL